MGNHTFPIGLAWRVLSHLLLKVNKLFKSKINGNCRYEMYGIKQIIILQRNISSHNINKKNYIRYFSYFRMLSKGRARQVQIPPPINGE